MDLNRNGVLDGYEIIGNGQLLLNTPDKIFGYNETVPLQARPMKDGKVIDIDDFNVVLFDIKKLSLVTRGTVSDLRTIYDREGTGALADIANIKDYITFKPSQVRAQKGIASYGFSTKNEDINIVFDARILTKDRYGKIIVDKRADPITLSVRSLHIAVTSNVKIGDTFSPKSVFDAGSTQGIRFNLNKVNKDQRGLPGASPYVLDIYDDVTNTRVGSPINISQSEYLFTDPQILNKSGIYRFEFTDREGVRGFTTLNILPALPVKIEAIPSSNTFIA